VNGVQRVEALAADAPAGGNKVAHTSMKRLDPAARRVVPAVQRAGMQMCSIKRCVLAVQLLGHNDLMPSKTVEIAQHVISVWADGVRPGKMMRARILDAVSMAFN
jgi:hypothetical protein